MQVTQEQRARREKLTLDMVELGLTPFQTVLVWEIADAHSEVDAARSVQSLCQRFLSNECGDNSQ